MYGPLSAVFRKLNRFKNTTVKHLKVMDTLNIKQKEIAEKIKSGKNTFITGFAGSGKSYLIDHICKILKENKKKLCKNRNDWLCCYTN
jgi:ABC-type lipoprotein export system ATPase subunit